jgi:cell division protein ZapA (FtsZ GTPase activity inhibitor)
MGTEKPDTFNPSVMSDETKLKPNHIVPQAETTLPEEISTVVTISVLGHDYRICGKPLLIQTLADLVNNEIKKVKKSSPGLTDERDISIQASFRLAYNLNKCRKELEALTVTSKEAEEKIERFMASINHSLSEKE